MPRKYYKENASVDAVNTAIVYECPNTGNTVRYLPATHEFSGYEDRMGCSVSVYLECKSCGKNHTVYLRND